MGNKAEEYSWLHTIGRALEDRIAAMIPREITKLVPCLFVCGVLLLSVVARPASAQTAPSPDKEQIERGRKQFQQACGFCHGPDATGARSPDLVRSTLVAHDVKGDLLGEVICPSGDTEMNLGPRIDGPCLWSIEEHTPCSEWVFASEQRRTRLLLPRIVSRR